MWEGEHSDIHQPLSYPERVAAAQLMEPLIEGPQLVLVDDLQPGLDNPAWCTYGTCPNCAFLIGQDGRLHTVQSWADVAQLEAAMRELVGP